MYVCMYVCMYVNGETNSVLASVVTVVKVWDIKLDWFLGLYPEIALTSSGLRNRSCDHGYSTTAHWLLLNPSARRPSLRAGSAEVLHQLVYCGLLVSQGCSQNRWWPPLILLLVNKAQT